jgi:predicted alpha/beta superfamily hydrolase
VVQGQQWERYGEVYPGHTVAGDVRVMRGVGSHGLTPRDVLVHLPLAYDVQRGLRYPVLYLQDGQNVFDEETSFSGEWGADEAAGRLASYGHEAILVAVPNAGESRAEEYSPWPIDPANRRAHPKADAYVAFLTQTIKPLVDASFRTRGDRASTGIAGSSLGGLIALYAALTQPAVFGYCAALSPAFWVGRERITTVARRFRAPGLRVYLDAGRREGGPRFVQQVRRMRDLLRGQGYEVAYVEDEEGEHSEAAWRRRFPAALAWFIDPAAKPDEARGELNLDTPAQPAAL